MATHALRLSLMILLVLSSASCQAEDAEDADSSAAALSGPSDAEANACEESSRQTNALGDKIVLCKRPFADAPFVRLPADKMGRTLTFYGGVTLPTSFDGAFVLWTRDGKRFVPIDEGGTPIPFDDGSKLPAKLHAPTNRATFTLYELTGTSTSTRIDTAHGPATGIRLKSARPVIEIDGCALDSRLAGTWEGTVSERLPVAQGFGSFAKHFDEAKRIPIRVKLESLESHPNLAEYAGGVAIADAKTFLLRGVVENFDHAVVEGSTRFPSLTAMGQKNPFYGATDGKIELYRLGNMHGQSNDGHWVLTYPHGSSDISLNGMSFTLNAATAPSLFVSAEAEGAASLHNIEIAPHMPFAGSGHLVVLTPKKIGAETGHCPSR